MADGRLYARAGTEEAGLAAALAWLWRLGPVRAEPAADAVGIGGPGQAAELRALVAAGRLAGAVVFAGEEGPAADGLPARRRVTGPARLADGVRVVADAGAFASGEPATRSSLGVHAVRDGRLLALAAGPGAWARLDAFWWLEAVADLLVEALDRPLVLLPALGCLRLDDLPGTAQHQVEGRAHPDDRQRRRVRAIARALRASGARLTVAVAARALEDERPVPLDRVWPDSVAAIAAAVGDGLLEPACHGTLHLDTEAWAQGRVEPREFARLSEPEAGGRIDEAMAWLAEHVGPAPTFIAPAWGYSEGTLAAVAARGLPTWLPPVAGPLVDGVGFRETVHDGLPGLHRLDYRPLVRLAAAGLPPTVVFHGGLLDHRLADLRMPRDAWPLARLALRRDLMRIPRVRGVRWVGAGELVAALRAHDSVEVRGAEVRAPEAREVTVWDRAGRRTAPAG